MEADSLWLQRSLTLPDPLPSMTSGADVPSSTTATTTRTTKTPPPPSSDERDGDGGSGAQADTVTRDGADDAPQQQQQHAQQATKTVAVASCLPPTPPLTTTTTTTAMTAATVAMTSMPPPPLALLAAAEKRTSSLSDMVAATPVAVTRHAASSSTQPLQQQQQQPPPTPLSGRYSTRASLSNMAYVGGGNGSMHEYDELRTRYMQAKRELLRLGDVQKDVEFARLELQRTGAEVQLLRESNRKLKKELDEAAQRAERERCSRLELEARVDAQGDSRQQEVAFLREQVEELRAHNATALAELAEQQESEHQRRYQALQQELISVCEERDALARDVAAAMRERAQLTQAADDARHDAARLRDELAERQRRVDVLMAQCDASEERLQSVLQQAEQEHARALDAQRTLYDERVAQVTAAKDAQLRELDDDVARAAQTRRALEREVAEQRHAAATATATLEHALAAHAKELRRVDEAHTLALAELKVQHDAALREATGGRYALDAELQSLRRQLAKLAEERTTLRATLTQRDAALANSEAALQQTRTQLARAEDDVARLRDEAAAAQAAAHDAHERVARVTSDAEAMAEDAARDADEARARIRALTEAVQDARAELAALRTEHVVASDADHGVIAALRRDVDALTAQRDALQRALAEQQTWQATAESFRKQFAAERQKAEGLHVELCATIARCAALERRLEEEQQCSTRRAHAPPTPSPPPHAGGGSGAAAAATASAAAAIHVVPPATHALANTSAHSMRPLSSHASLSASPSHTAGVDGSSSSSSTRRRCATAIVQQQPPPQSTTSRTLLRSVSRRRTRSASDEASGNNDTGDVRPDSPPQTASTTAPGAEAWRDEDDAATRTTMTTAHAHTASLTPGSVSVSAANKSSSHNNNTTVTNDCSSTVNRFTTDPTDHTHATHGHNNGGGNGGSTATPPAISKTASRSSLSQHTHATAWPSTPSTPPRPRVRSASSSNSCANMHTSGKRARTADARVFAISGFDGNELLQAITQLPGAAIAECKSNMPVPANLTHLVTNGQLTIKLLSALVRGCWVLPPSYVRDSHARGAWQREADYGFQHVQLPLLNKRVALTDSFVASRHYSTATLLLNEGGATVLDGDDAATTADLILCSNHETHLSDRHVNWEGMVEVLYPVRIE